jgi:hypothetical protein
MENNKNSSSNYHEITEEKLQRISEEKKQQIREKNKLAKQKQIDSFIYLFISLLSSFSI